MSIKLTVQEACANLSKIGGGVFSTYDVWTVLSHEYALTQTQVTTTMTRLVPDFLLRVSHGQYMLRREAVKAVDAKVYRSDLYTETCFVEVDGQTWGINHQGGKWYNRFSVDHLTNVNPVEVSRETARKLLTLWGAKPEWSDEQPAGQI